MYPIPEIKDPERFANIDFVNSSFVEIVSNDHFVVQMKYPQLGMEYAEKKCYVREEVFIMLNEAAGSLPEGYKLKILDAWRPFFLQEELFDKYSIKIIRDFELEDCSEEQKKKVIKRFVSEPIADRDVPPVHTTGGAVDVTIEGADGEELKMGTAFDAFTNLTYTAAFESEKNYEIRDNRRLLYYTMTRVGFTNLPSEWWHYDYGDRFWAYYNNKPAIYKGVFERKEMNGK